MNVQYEKLKSLLSEIQDINSTMAVLTWDKEIYMPDKGAGLRAQQIGTLSGVAHDKMIAPELADLINKLGSDDNLSPKQKKNIAFIAQDINDTKKYTKEYVIKSATVIASAFQAWQKARKANDFNLYKDKLSEVVALKLEQTKILGYEGHPYNALLNIYDQGITVKKLDVVFDNMKNKLSPLLEKIFAKPEPDTKFMYRQYDKDIQWSFGLHLLKQMGYDFEAGRQDLSPHPFTINFSAHDVRVTTRVDEKNLYEMIWSCIHEGGHALYEQGLNINDYGLPSGKYLSLSMHESQSRIWENNIGRSLIYWKENFKELKSVFPDKLKDVAFKDFYKAINIVKQTPIRTASDELTYHFHVLIRYEIEKALISGDINVNEVGDYWNEQYKKYLNIDIKNDNEGVLQDIHWSHGSFGYFPTYSLGSFYAAQFYQKAIAENSDIEKNIDNGNMLPMLHWLRENIHQHGKLATSEELCEQVTGEKLNFDYFMRYAYKKYSDIYAL